MTAFEGMTSHKKIREKNEDYVRFGSVHLSFHEKNCDMRKTGQ